jgi:hypothetical protein
MDDLVRPFAYDTIQLIFCIQEEGAPHNVLAQHHRKNRSNRPPDLARLSTAAIHQAAVHQANNHTQDHVENNPQESDSEPEDNSRAPRHSRSTGELRPDTMAYYRGTPWMAILTQAKIKYRRHIVLNHGFPDRDAHLGNARDILLQAIEEFKDENGVLDQSKLSLFIYMYFCLSFY